MTLTRRSFNQIATASVLGAGLPTAAAAAGRSIAPKSVAAVITVYEDGLHADVILGKILDGWEQTGGPGPALRLASMYVDQFTKRDLARPQSKKHHVPIFDTIEAALTLGGNQIPVDGVLSIGEHGTYPYNNKKQHLYPRRRFFEQITNTFVKYKKVVPVFGDKHLGPQWPDALWMYNRARELRVPLMAGSSMPVGFRVPDVAIPIGSHVEAVVGIGYSGLDIYGFHALELLQSQVERRSGAENGVKWVQCLQGDAMWRALDDGTVPQAVLNAALEVTPHPEGVSMRNSKDAALFLFQYTDGPLASILMLPGFVTDTSVALKIASQQKPIALRFDSRMEPHFPHFAYLLKAIERMFHTGHPTYPVERTLLTGGILDKALTSLANGQTRIDTPELAIKYKPVDYPHAPHVDLRAAPAS